MFLGGRERSASRKGSEREGSGSDISFSWAHQWNRIRVRSVGGRLDKCLGGREEGGI